MNICENLITKLMMFCLIVGVVLLAGAPPVSAANVNIPDAALRRSINEALGANRAVDAAVTEAEMKTLTSLSPGYISNLTGLEKATNLTKLDLYGNFTDISALSRLTNLTTLVLVPYPRAGRRLTDISALSGLTNLTTLALYGMTDISTLPQLDKPHKAVSVRQLNRPLGTVKVDKPNMAVSVRQHNQPLGTVKVDKPHNADYEAHGRHLDTAQLDKPHKT